MCQRKSAYQTKDKNEDILYEINLIKQNFQNRQTKQPVERKRLECARITDVSNLNWVWGSKVLKVLSFSSRAGKLKSCVIAHPQQ